MNSHTEVEAKWTMGRADFDRLLLNCRTLRRVEQLNVYFDYHWALAKVGATCRLRFAPRAAAIFTLKIPVAWVAEGTRTAMELEMPATAALGPGASVLWRTFDGGALTTSVRDALRSLNVSRLQRVGWMRNTRHVLQLPAGGLFELDRFCLPGGGVSYEAEVEESDPLARDSIVEAIRNVVPTARPSQLSKFQRFKEAAQRLARSSAAGAI
jgi:uncharacterized protein YjbK